MIYIMRVMGVDEMKKIRLAIIGAGGIAEKRVIPALQGSERFTIEAIMRTDPIKLGELQRRFHIPNGYTSVAELLANPDVDAVYIASPVHVHAEQAIQAANAGKMILLEKPAGMNRSEVEAIREACRRNGVFFAGALMMRYHRLHERMREMIADGCIGKPVTVRIDFHFAYPDQHGAWRQIKRLGGGGVLMDLGPHCFDTLQAMLGCRIAKVKSAFMNTQTYHYEVEDSATIVLEVEGGAHAVVSVHFNIPEEVSATRFEVFGTEGRLHAEGTLGQVEAGQLHVWRANSDGQASLTMDSLDERIEKEEPGLQYSLYVKEFERFETSMRNPAIWESVMEEQIALQTLLDTCYQLASSGE